MTPNNDLWEDAYNVSEEFILCHAKGFPDPLNVHPPTLADARRKQSMYGGTIKRRVVSEWEDIPAP